LLSRDVHSPARVQYFHPKYDEYFPQKDLGLRELKEIIVVSDDGRMVHHILSSNQSIYNEEYLSVSTQAPSSCKGLLVE
jgi:hypothetical protein